MAFALRLALVLITLACLALFVTHPWWFPAGASEQAAALDYEFRAAFWLLGTLFVAAQILLAVFLARPRRSNDNVSRWRGDWRWETGWTLGIAILFFWFHFSGGHMWSQMGFPARQSGQVRIEVTGAQFQWYFRYPGADGVFGRVDAQKFARPDEGNPLGLDPGDPAGRDDIVSSTLVVPVGRLVQLDLRAQDVIHSIFIPAMRLKQDAVPGMEIHTHFTPTETGTYEIVCTQLCGLGHYRMRAVARVVNEEEFKQWLKAHEKTSGAQ